MSAPSSSRVWFITGCSSGLGRALAGRVLARGERVIATARNSEPLAALANQYPDTCRPLALDVTDPTAVKHVVAEAAEIYGRIDVVVNNAGYGLAGAFEELETEQIARNFETNLFGPLAVIRATLPILRAQQSGHIVNISAAAAIENYAGLSIYGASKAALAAVSESLRLELKPLGINVTIIEPGPLRTNFVGRSLDRSERRIPAYEGSSGQFLRLLDSTDGKQPGDPDRAAEAIITLVHTNAPPHRLILGKYANYKAHRKYAEAEKERADWEHLGLAADFKLNHAT